MARSIPTGPFSFKAPATHLFRQYRNFPYCPTMTFASGSGRATRSFRFAVPQVNDAALEADRDGTRAVGGFEFLEDVLDVHLDGAAGGPQARRNFLVRQPPGGQLQDFHLAWGESGLWKVFGEALRGIRLHQFPSGMDDAN